MIAGGLGEHDARAIVTSLYHELLRRDPDAAGLAGFGAQLTGAPPAAVIPAIVGQLNASPEAARVRFGAVLSQIAAGVVAARGRAARPVIGLGTHCYTATLLQSAGVKGASYPFDWIFASPPMVAHALSDDFATFLDRRYYEPVPVEKRRDGPDVNLCDHAFYRDAHGVPFVFNHRDPLLPEDYAYLERCVERFRRAAKDDAPVLLMVTFPTHDDRAAFDEVSRAVRAYAPSASLLYVSVGEPGAALPASTVLHDDRGHALVSLRPGSRWQSLWFENPLDDIHLLTLALERT